MKSQWNGAYAGAGGKALRDGEDTFSGGCPSIRQRWTTAAYISGDTELADQRLCEKWTKVVGKYDHGGWSVYSRKSQCPCSG